MSLTRDSGWGHSATRPDPKCVVAVQKLFAILMRTGCNTSAQLNAISTAHGGHSLLQALVTRSNPATTFAVCCLLRQPLTRVDLPRCAESLRRGGGMCVPVPGMTPTLLSHASAFWSDADWEWLISPNERFAAQMLAEEYAYAEHGVCGCKTEIAWADMGDDGDDESAPVLMNPLQNNSLPEARFRWLITHLPAQRVCAFRDKYGQLTALQFALHQGWAGCARALVARACEGIDMTTSDHVA